MVTGLAIGCIVLLLLSAAIFLWFAPGIRQQRKAAALHAESVLQQSASRADHPSLKRLTDMDRWQAWLIRANLPPTHKTLVLLALPALIASLFALLRSGSLLFALFTALVVALCTAAWLYRRVIIQQRTIVAQLPDFLEHMVRIAAVGNSLPMAFQGATSHAKPPLLPVLEAAQRNTRAGMDMDRALYQAAQTYHVQPLEMVSLIMGTSMRIGGRSDQIIQRMADFMRDVEEASRELAATTSETRMSAIVLGLLPIVCGLMMALSSPGFFNPMFESALGMKILFLGVLLEVVGITLLWRISRSL